MQKLKLQTADMAERNIETLGQLFPSCLTEKINDEGKLVKAIDFDKLRQELACEVVEGAEERYQFTWPDKRNAIRLANSPINKTLRPCREESVNFDNTENLYIEGDNLEVLKLLRENYLGKVKMIYIDPPYNTGNDFVYNDDFAQSQAEFAEQSGLFDEEGNRLTDPMVQNTESNGRFHTDWLNMIYPRLKVAKDLLADDGVIFISIDDNEVENLRKICNEIFGENNIFTFIWSLPRGINAGLIARAHEYVICITRNSLIRKNFNRLSADVEYSIERCNKKIDSRHPESIIEFREGIRYEGKDQILEGIIDGSEKITIIGQMIFQNGKLMHPVKLSAGWTMKNMILDWMNGKKVYDLKGQPIVEFFFKENGKLYSKKEIQTLSIKSILKDIPDSQIARKQMERLFGSQDIFSYPKPIELSLLLSKLITNKSDIILDFFSGSATTAHSVMQLNAEDGGNRKFIMVQIPEKTDEKSEAYKAGYKNICEIGKERIRRAGRKIKEELAVKNEELAVKLDTGFRVLKLDSSNMKDVYYTPAETPIQQTLGFDELVDNIKWDEGRTAEDLLFQVLPECNLPLSSKIEEREIHGKNVFVVNDGYLIACFDKNINESVITAIAKEKPYYFVMCDSSIATDNVADNFEQIFEAYSKDTVRRIL